MIGKILWWDKRDGKGIVETENGDEYYIDSSVLVPRSLSETIKRDQLVTFDKNEKIKNCNCGRNVKILN